MECERLLEQALGRLAVALEAGESRLYETKLVLALVRRARQLYPVTEAQCELDFAAGYLDQVSKGLAPAEYLGRAAERVRQAYRTLRGI